MNRTALCAGVFLLTMMGLGPTWAESSREVLAPGTQVLRLAQAPQPGGEMTRQPFESDMGYDLRKMAGTRPTAPSGELGSKTRPIRCANPPGEREYLARLRDTTGNPVRFQRRGSVGNGPYGHILDLYVGTTSDGKEVRVHMDMYFTKLVDEKPVPGFTLAPTP